jgi:hypothetical protein
MSDVSISHLKNLYNHVELPTVISSQFVDKLLRTHKGMIHLFLCKETRDLGNGVFIVKFFLVK